jgi:hypothetical protein
MHSRGATKPNERINVMSETTTEFERTEQEFLIFDVPDAMLEAAAGTLRENAGNYTLGACTGLSVCPM